MNGDQQSWQRNQYRTTARVQMDDRRLLLRGGPYDGRIWLGVVAIGDRVFCGGTAPWSMAGMYVVTAAVETYEGDEVNIAVPILATV